MSDLTAAIIAGAVGGIIGVAFLALMVAIDRHVSHILRSRRRYKKMCKETLAEPKGKLKVILGGKHDK
jgi:hypothetical protein